MNLELIVNGFASIMSFSCMAIIFLGVGLGIIFGAIPGLTATMAVALCLPISYGMGPVMGISLLLGLYIGGVSGGLISAILLKIPGTPSSVATTWDGGPMADRGEAGRALSIGIIYSFIGGMISIFVLMFISPPLARVALKFTPFEYFAIGVFSLTLISSLVSGSIFKALAAAVIGILFAMVGSAPIDAFPRFTFGIRELDAGFNILPVLIGLFAISEILATAEDKGTSVGKNNILSYKTKGLGFTLLEFKNEFFNMIRSAFIGIGIGILPGIGGGTANIVSYLTAKSQAKNKDEYGNGAMGGIVASETSNNAAVGGALVPLLALGIPGDTVTAMLLGGLMIHGLTPGPLLFVQNVEIVYTIFAALLVAHVAMIIMEFYGLRLFVKLLAIPKHILLPVIMALCVVGAFGLNNRVFDVFAILIFGIVGYVFGKFKFPLTPMILGFILGPMVEVNLRRGLMQSSGSFLPFITRPICIVFLGIGAISVIISVYKEMKKAKKSIAVKE